MTYADCAGDRRPEIIHYEYHGRSCHDAECYCPISANVIAGDFKGCLGARGAVQCRDSGDASRDRSGAALFTGTVICSFHVILDYASWLIIATQSALLLSAAWTDVASRLVSDRVCVAMAIVGGVLQLLLVGPLQLGESIVIALILFGGRYCFCTVAACLAAATSNCSPSSQLVCRPLAYWVCSWLQRWPAACSLSRIWRCAGCRVRVPIWHFRTIETATDGNFAVFMSSSAGASCDMRRCPTHWRSPVAGFGPC